MQMLKYIISCFYFCSCCASFSYCFHCPDCFDSAATEQAFAIRFDVEASAVAVQVFVTAAVAQAFAIAAIGAFSFVRAADA